MRKISKGDEDFYQGMLAALAVVAAHDQETIYREIIDTADENDLIQVALSDEGTAEWAGLYKYNYIAKE